MVSDTALKEAARDDPLNQSTAKAPPASMGPVVLEEGQRSLGPVGPWSRPWLVVPEDLAFGRPSHVL